MHFSINPEEIKTEIEKLGRTVTYIWKIKQYRTKLPLSVFYRIKPTLRVFVELQPAPNNCGMHTTMQNKIRTAQL
jgi:hypothetical protein